MPGQPGFRSVEERPGELSAQGDPLEKLLGIVDVELSRAALNDAVLKLEMPRLQAQHGLSLEARERLVRDRLSWMRLCGLAIADPVPDASTLWDFREALIRAGALSGLSGQLDRTIKEAGWRWAVGSSMRAW